MSLLLALLFAVPVNQEATLYRFEVTIFQGNPDGSKEKGNLQVISSPQIITRDGQEAIVSVGQQVPVVTDIKRDAGVITSTLSQEQAGIILRITPKTQSDKSVVISTKVNLKEIVPDQNSIVEQTITACRLTQPGEVLKVPFYNLSSCRTRVTLPFVGLYYDIMKYTGKEIWMEVKVSEMKESDLKP